MHADCTPCSILVLRNSNWPRLHRRCRYDRRRHDRGDSALHVAEQIQSQEIDARSDLFSLGSILYEMLTGKRAFEGASVPVVAAALIDREPPPAPLLQSQPPLDHIVRRCLAKNPSERWRTATDVLQELKWAAQIVRRSRESTFADAQPSQPTSGRSQPLGTGQAIQAVRRFIPWLAALVAAVALGVWVGTRTARTSADLPLTFFIEAPDGAMFDLTADDAVSRSIT